MIDPDRIEQVRRLVGAGLTSVEIARMMGVSKRTVERYRQHAKITKPAPPPFTEEEVDRARAMLEDGASYQEVCRTLGRSWGAIEKRVPGYKFNEKQRLELAALGRARARLERRVS